jgi:CHAT domain-containing protein
LYSIGKIKAAEKVYQDLLAKVDKDDPAVRLSSLYNNLALTYNKLGKYDEYLNLQFQALEVAENDDNYNHQIDIFRNLFIYYRQNNNEENAFEYLSKAQELAKEEGNITDLGNLYVSQGASIRQFNNNYQKAFDYFAKAEEILDPKNNSENYIFLLNEQANTFEKQKKYSDAIEKYDRILTLLPEDNPNHLDAIVNKALNHLDLGNIDKAGELITKFQSYDLSKLEFQQIIKAKTVEADYLHSVGKSERALDILEPALRQVVVRAKSSADLKSGYWYVEDEYLDAFELIVAIYKQNNKLDQAIEKLDQLKTINDASLYQNPLVKSSLLNESQLTEYKQLTNQLDATRKKLLTAPEDQKLGIRQNISQLKLKKRKLDRKLTAQIQSDPITIREVRNNLSARELVMHITELNNQYYIAKISRSNVELNTIPLDSTRRNLLSGAVQQVATNQTNLDTLYTISNMLKLKQIPDRIEQVTLIPDSYFYQLPIDILPLQQPAHSYSYGQVTYAIEQFRTQYLTSLDDLKSEAPAQTKSKNNLSYTGFGVSNFSGYNKKSLVPLPHAKTEVNNIAGQLTNMSKVNTYINNQSTKPIFKQAAPKSEIIHLATHSEVSERDPMFSTVYLSKRANTADSTFDDQLFAYELFELNLSNEMIMLNSCESGSGPYIQGTGVMGISRALQYAGARSLILNLWSVNDQLAADFATHFYQQLNKGKSKGEAMRTTKRYFLKTKNASPHFWGPYMLIGNDNPIIQPDREKNLAMAGVFIFYFLLMVGLSYLAQQGSLFRDSKESNVS